MNCGVGWLFFTALENLKKENNRLGATNEIQHWKGAAPKKTLISGSWRKVYPYPAGVDREKVPK